MSVGKISYVTLLVGFLSPMQPEPVGSTMNLMSLPAKNLVSDNYWLALSPFSRGSSSGFPVRHRAIYRSFTSKATPKFAKRMAQSAKRKVNSKR
jgi:hypothetical protein